jgi:serine/arginine repetitive matrix protein 2
VFSSPSLPPPIRFARGQPLLAVQTEDTGRPGLSPIARAGRALQEAVGPTSSPRGRAQSLGSPFKSPVADRKSSSSVAPSSLSPSQEQRADVLLRSDVAGNLFPNPWNTANHHDDPFSNNAPTNQQHVVPAEKYAYTLGLPEQGRLSDPRLCSIRSEGNSVLSDDAMSWQAEEEVAANGATTSLINNINSPAVQGSSSVEPSRLDSENKTRKLEQKWASERDAVRKQIESASQVIVIDSDEETPDGSDIEENDEDFGLLLETLNSSSPVIQQPKVLAKDNVERPRRSKLPSPWRKNSKRLVYSDELLRLSSPPAAANVSLGKDSTNKRVSEDENALDLSSFIIPQKENFKPRLRDTGNLDLSALLASSPNKAKLPVLTKSSQNNTSLPQEPSYTSAFSFQTEESDRGKVQSFIPIPQKRGFRPRSGDADASSIFGSSPLKSNTYVNNIFGVHTNKGTVVQNLTPELSSSSASEPLGLSSPSRTNSLRIPVQRSLAHLSDSECIYNSSLSATSQDEKENQSIDNRTLKWTETVRLASTQIQPLISPTKSCLRSPLKTPSNAFGSGGNCENASPSKNVAFVSSSPLPSSPTAERLSSTAWSKDHWVLLDSILQAWKPENNGGSEDGPKGGRRNSTRVISRLLGKKVFSQGEEMRLKQWHLEVVDEFRGMVPGWEEKVVAMRVFACIVGEERRKGLIGGGWGAEEVNQSI